MSNNEEETMLNLIATLGTGREYAQSLTDLAATIDADALEIQECIEDLQAQGVLIVCDKEGRYYVAQSPEEWLAYKRSHLTPEALALVKRQRAMEQAAAERWLVPAYGYPREAA